MEELVTSIDSLKHPHLKTAEQSATTTSTANSSTNSSSIDEKKTELAEVIDEVVTDSVTVVDRKIELAITIGKMLTKNCSIRLLTLKGKLLKLIKPHWLPEWRAELFHIINNLTLTKNVYRDSKIDRYRNPYYVTNSNNDNNDNVDADDVDDGGDDDDDDNITNGQFSPTVTELVVTFGSVDNLTYTQNSRWFGRDFAQTSGPVWTVGDAKIERKPSIQNMQNDYVLTSQICIATKRHLAQKHLALKSLPLNLWYEILAELVWQLSCRKKYLNLPCSNPPTSTSTSTSAFVAYDPTIDGPYHSAYLWPQHYNSHLFAGLANEKARQLQPGKWNDSNSIKSINEYLSSSRSQLIDTIAVQQLKYVAKFILGRQCTDTLTVNIVTGVTSTSTTTAVSAIDELEGHLIITELASLKKAILDGYCSGIFPTKLLDDGCTQFLLKLPRTCDEKITEAVETGWWKELFQGTNIHEELVVQIECNKDKFKMFTDNQFLCLVEWIIYLRCCAEKLKKLSVPKNFPSLTKDDFSDLVNIRGDLANPEFSKQMQDHAAICDEVRRLLSPAASSGTPTTTISSSSTIPIIAIIPVDLVSIILDYFPPQLPWDKTE